MTPEKRSGIVVLGGLTFASVFVMWAKWNGVIPPSSVSTETLWILLPIGTAWIWIQVARDRSWPSFAPPAARPVRAPAPVPAPTATKPLELPQRKPPADPAELSRVCERLSDGKPWLVFRHGTTILGRIADGSPESEGQSLEDRLARWRELGPAFDDYVTYTLKEDLGWMVTSANHSGLFSVILPHERPAESDPTAITLLGVVKRHADWEEPEIVARSE